MDELQAQRDRLTSEIEALGDEEAPGVDSATWQGWWTAVNERCLAFEMPSEPAGSDTRRRLEDAIGGLAAERQNLRRRLEVVRRLAETAPSDPPSSSSRDDLRERLGRLLCELEAASADLASAQEEASERRRRMRELAERDAQMQALAELAIKLIDERCPVCTQEFDRSVTEAHLLHVISRGTAPLEPVIDGADDELERLSQRLALLEKDVAECQGALDSSSKQAALRSEFVAACAELATQAGQELLGDGVIGSDPRALLDAAGTNETKLTDLIRAGERMALSLARRAETTRRKEAVRNFEAISGRITKMGAQFQAQVAAGKTCQTIVDGTREAGLEIVGRELSRIAPTLDQIYSTLDPHPSFTTLRLLSRLSYGKGRVSASISDPKRSISSDTPELLLSSSQLNALAISVFLALNAALPSIPLHAAVLDDPLQSLDDVNLLGLVDLLRRLRSQRQMSISTHDERFGRLLERKLRPSKGERTLVLRFGRWDPSDPGVECVQLRADQSRLRLVV